VYDYDDYDDNDHFNNNSNILHGPYKLQQYNATALPVAVVVS